MPPDAPPRWRRPVPLALGLALLLSLSTLAVPWVMDDWFILMTNAAWLGDESAHWWAISETQRDPLGLPSSFCFADAQDGARWIRAGVYPWWTDPALRLCFWRPLASLSHLADAAAGLGPRGAHLHGLAWYLLLCAGVARFWSRRLGAGAPGSPDGAGAGTAPGTGGLALLAAALYAIDDAHAFPVAWVANRNALIAAAFAAWALVAHDRGRPLVATLLVGLGLLGGEAGLGAVGLLAAHALVYGTGPRLRRLVPVLPAAALALAWLGAYTALGFGASGSGLYTSPVSDPLAWLAGAAAHLPILGALLLAPMPADLLMADPGLLPLVLVQALVVLGLVGWGLRRLWPTLAPHEQQALAFALLGTALAALPALSTAPTSRLVTLPGIAGVAALAIMVRGFLRERRKPKAERHRRIFGLGAFMAFFHLVLAPLAWPGISAFLALGDDQSRALLADTEAALAGTESAVLLVASDPALTVYLPDAAVALGRPVPHWTTLSHTPVDHSVRRTGPASLELRTGGMPMNRRPFAALYRAPGARFAPGQTVETADYTAEVVEVGPDGHPTAVRFAFPRDLDDPRLGLLHWDGHALVRWTPPAVGETAVLAWSEGITGM